MDKVVKVDMDVVDTVDVDKVEMEEAEASQPRPTSIVAYILL